MRAQPGCQKSICFNTPHTTVRRLSSSIKPPRGTARLYTKRVPKTDCTSTKWRNNTATRQTGDTVSSNLQRSAQFHGGTRPSREARSSVPPWNSEDPWPLTGGVVTSVKNAAFLAYLLLRRRHRRSPRLHIQES